MLNQNLVWTLIQHLWILRFGIVFMNILQDITFLQMISTNKNSTNYVSGQHIVNHGHIWRKKDHQRIKKRPVGGITRLNSFNFSNITRLNNIVHRGSHVVVEIPNNCLILFEGNAFYSGISTCERGNDSYLSNLRIFSYIVKNVYIIRDENINSLLQQTLCKPTCHIC